MIIIGVAGGLGNQMFQYAFYRALKQRGKRVKLDLDLKWHGIYEMHNGYELKKIFGIEEDVAEYREIVKLAGGSGWCDKLRRRLRLKKTFYFTCKLEDCIRFQSCFFDMDNMYLFSGWQSEKYFKDIKDIIKKEFLFKPELNRKSAIFANEISKENAVSIHIRRGDYVKNRDLGGICTIEYFKRAAEYIQSRVMDVKFYVFSDDISWCKTSLGIDNVKYVDCNTAEYSYQDMQLMTLCKHHIISNSTFSWWGAWLSENSSKIVIAPSKWFNDITGTIDIIPESWVKL